MQAVYILSAVRTPIGKFGGSLASLTAADMGVVAAKAAIERAGIQPEQVEESIFGNARQAGGGPNVARQISIRSGVPQEVASVHGEQSLRFGDEVDRAGLSVDSAWRCELYSGGRNGIHVARSLLSRSALGIPTGQSGTGRRHVSRRIFLSDGENGDGRNRRGAGGALQDHARRAG